MLLVADGFLPRGAKMKAVVAVRALGAVKDLL
jgi:hypothetical protein